MISNAESRWWRRRQFRRVGKVTLGSHYNDGSYKTDDKHENFSVTLLYRLTFVTVEAVVGDPQRGTIATYLLDYTRWVVAGIAANDSFPLPCTVAVIPYALYVRDVTSLATLNDKRCLHVRRYTTFFRAAARDSGIFYGWLNNLDNSEWWDIRMSILRKKYHVF